MAEQYPDVFRDEAGKTMDLVLLYLDNEVTKRTPRGVGGLAGLAGAIFGERVAAEGNVVKGLVGHRSPYGEVIEEGRRPGRRMPPVGPIELWARSILGVPAGKKARSAAFAIARSIAIHGFKGKHMFRNAWNANERWVQQQMQTIGPKMATRLNGIGR